MCRTLTLLPRKNYKSVAEGRSRIADLMRGALSCVSAPLRASRKMKATLFLIRNPQSAIRILIAPRGDALCEALVERSGPPARGERLKERYVSAPVLRVSGARVAAASNLFRGRDERAHLFGEVEHTRLFAARNVDDVEAAAHDGRVRREFEYRRRGVVNVNVVARLIARSFEPRGRLRACELTVQLPHEQTPLRLAKDGEESADDEGELEALGVLAREQLARGLVESVRRDGAHARAFGDGPCGGVAVDRGARREDDERTRAGASHGVEHVGPRQ